jgi:hypothetical protein
LKIVPTPSAAVTDRLAFFYHRNGYIRRRILKTRSADGRTARRPADELRLTARSAEEIHTIRGLLKRAGFTPGREWAKKRQYRIPVYGRRAVDRFLALLSSRDGA